METLLGMCKHSFPQERTVTYLLTTVDLGQVCQLREGLSVAQRHKVNSMVGERRHGRESSRLLATSWSATRHKDSS